MDVITEACRRFVVNAGDRRGVGQRDLAKYVVAYRDAGLAERERVHQALASTPGIAWLNRTDGWRFWPRAYAPEEATRA